MMVVTIGFAAFFQSCVFSGKFTGKLLGKYRAFKSHVFDFYWVTSPVFPKKWVNNNMATAFRWRVVVIRNFREELISSSCAPHQF